MCIDPEGNEFSDGRERRLVMPAASSRSLDHCKLSKHPQTALHTSIWGEDRTPSAAAQDTHADVLEVVFFERCIVLQTVLT